MLKVLLKGRCALFGRLDMYLTLRKKEGGKETSIHHLRNYFFEETELELSFKGEMRLNYG